MDMLSGEPINSVGKSVVDQVITMALDYYHIPEKIKTTVCHYLQGMRMKSGKRSATIDWAEKRYFDKK